MKNIRKSNCQYLKMERYMSFLLPFLPFLWPYRIPGTTINLQVATLLGIVIYLFIICGLKKIVWPKFFLAFFIYAIIVPFVGFFKFGDLNHFISSYIPIVTFTAAYLMLRPYLRIELVYKYYKKLVYLAVSLFLCQTVMYYILGYRIVGLIPFMPITYVNLEMEAYIDMLSTLDRSASFFLEPAHFSQYVVAFLAMHLGILEERGRFIDRLSLFISFVMICTFSGSAYALVIIVWFLHFLLSKRSLYLKLCVGCIMLVFSFYAFDYYAQTEGGSHVIDRANTLAEVNENNQSEFIRIYRGWMLYNDTPQNLLITGVGGSNITCIIESSRLRWAFGEEDRFVNNAQCLCLGYGYIGSFMFILFLFFLMYKQKKVNVYMISVFIVLCFIESFWCNSLMLIYLIIPTLCTELKENQYIIKE